YLTGAEGDVPAPRDRAGQIAERGRAQGGDWSGGAFQQRGGRAAGEARQRDQQMQAACLWVAAVERELPRPVERVGERGRRLLGGLPQRGELCEHPVLVTAALSQEHVGGAGDRERRQQEV